MARKLISSYTDIETMRRDEKEHGPCLVSRIDKEKCRIVSADIENDKFVLDSGDFMMPQFIVSLHYDWEDGTAFGVVTVEGEDNGGVFDGVRVISTSKRDFIFPEEGWFVGASNSNFGGDYFRCAYLYKPQWTQHGSRSWGGYTSRREDGICDWWWTFNQTYGTISKDFLYYCKDGESAKRVADFLNSMPSKNYGMIKKDVEKLKGDIKDMCKQIEELQCQIDKLEGSFGLIDEMLKKIE